MRLWERLDFRAKLSVHAMVAAGLALLLTIASFATYDELRMRRKIEAELVQAAEHLATSSGAAIASGLVLSQTALGTRSRRRSPITASTPIRRSRSIRAVVSSGQAPRRS